VVGVSVVSVLSFSIEIDRKNLQWMDAKKNLVYQVMEGVGSAEQGGSWVM
jgi:hypothetical protein